VNEGKIGVFGAGGSVSRHPPSRRKWGEGCRKKKSRLKITGWTKSGTQGVKRKRASKGRGQIGGMREKGKDW